MSSRRRKRDTAEETKPEEEEDQEEEEEDVSTPDAQGVSLLCFENFQGILIIRVWHSLSLYALRDLLQPLFQ